MNTPLTKPDPFAAPSSPSSTQHLNEVYNNQPFYAPSGRIGRIRYIAYNMIAGLILIAVFFIVGIFAGIFAEAISGESTIVTMLLGLVTIIGGVGSIYISIVLAIRRLHDLNMTGWLSLIMLIPIISFFFWLYLIFAPGTQGVNQYGAPAKPPNTAMIVLAVILPIVGTAVIGILAAIAIPAYDSYIERALEADMQSTLGSD